MTRWLVIRDDPSRAAPFVLAETAIEWEARDYMSPLKVDAVVRRDETMSDPRWRAAVEAWDRGDDSIAMAFVHAERAEIEASEQLERGWWAAVREGALFPACFTCGKPVRLRTGQEFNGWEHAGKLRDHQAVPCR